MDDGQLGFRANIKNPPVQCRPVWDFLLFYCLIGAKIGERIVGHSIVDIHADLDVFQHRRHSTNVIGVGVCRDDQIQFFDATGLQAFGDVGSIGAGIDEDPLVTGCLNEDGVTLSNVQYVHLKSSSRCKGEPQGERAYSILVSILIR